METKAMIEGLNKTDNYGSPTSESPGMENNAISPDKLSNFQASHSEMTETSQPKAFREPHIENLTNFDHLSKFSWALTEDDPDNSDNILVWRKISEMSPELAATDGHLSYRAATESSFEEIKEARLNMQRIRERMLEQFLGEDKKKIARSYIWSSGILHDRQSPVLHTTFDRSNSQGIPYQGVVIEYSVPKQYILDHEDEILASTGGETELGFLYGLEQQMIKNVTWKDEDGNEITQSANEIRGSETEEEESTDNENSTTFSF